MEEQQLFTDERRVRDPQFEIRMRDIIEKINSGGLNINTLDRRSRDLVFEYCARHPQR